MCKVVSSHLRQHRTEQIARHLLEPSRWSACSRIPHYHTIWNLCGSFINPDKFHSFAVHPIRVVILAYHDHRHIRRYVIQYVSGWSQRSKYAIFKTGTAHNLLVRVARHIIFYRRHIIVYALLICKADTIHYLSGA